MTLPEIIDDLAGAIRPAVDCSCPACQSTALVEFFDLPSVPVHVCVLFDTPEEAIQAPTGDISLVYCQHCGFVKNRQFEPDKLPFEPGYEASLFFSPVFRDYMDQLIERLIDTYDLRGKNIVEVGCGAGGFLELLCQRGDNHGVGFDPTLSGELTKQVGNGSVRLVRDYFGEQYADLPCDFICCLSVMEDLPQPVEFVTGLRHILGNRPVDGYFEVFNGMRPFEHQETWSVLYEQCNLFSEQTFADLFCRGGFEVLKSGKSYMGDQYVYAEVSTSSQNNEIQHPSTDTGGDLPDAIVQFSQHYQRCLSEWRERLSRLKAEGKRVVLWGSAGKGVSFLNAFKDLRAVDCVVDINERRQGKFMPGTGERIVSPEQMREYRPDLVIVSNGIYEPEIRQQMSELGVDTEFEVA